MRRTALSVRVDHTCTSANAYLRAQMEPIYLVKCALTVLLGARGVMEQLIAQAALTNTITTLLLGSALAATVSA